MRKRLAVLAAAAVAMLGLAPFSEASAGEAPWLCLANRDANVGACLYDPL